MELEDYTNDEIRALKFMMNTVGEKKVDLTDVPSFDAGEKEAILKLFSELIVLPSAMHDGLYAGDDLVPNVVSVTAAMFGPFGNPPESEISLLTLALQVAKRAYDLGVHDAALGQLSRECQQRVAAEVENQLEMSKQLMEFHDWLEDL